MRTRLVTNRIKGLPAVLFFLLSLIPVLAQERTGAIYGRVTDSTGGIIVGATVTVTNQQTGLSRVLFTNDEGNYSAPKLATGTYGVEVELVGFKKLQRPDIILGGGTIAEINVSLEIGEVSDVVTVVGSAPLVNTSSGAVRSSLENVFIDRLPLNGRDANQLMLLIPGVTPSNTGGGGAASYNAYGVRGTSNYFTLDGTDNMDAFNSKGSNLPPPDALKEFTVQSNYSAEYGGGGGVTVIALTRSGTNALHGSVYDYFRSENLNANSFQRNAQGLSKGDFKRHQLGFTTGGPVYLPKIYDGRNKTFFFFSHQALKTPSNPYLWQRGGLTAAELAGDFSKSAIIPRVSSAAAAAPNSPFAGKSGQPVTNLSSLLSPTALRWYNYFKIPIVENSGQFSFVPKSQSLNLPEYALRIDHALAKNNSLSFSMSYRHNAPDIRQINSAPERFLSGIQRKDQHYTLSDVWTISPTIVNEFLIGYNRIWEPVETSFGDTDYAQLGIKHPQLHAGQFIQIATLSPSFFNFNATNLKHEGRDAYDFRDSVSFMKGNHFMKAGGFFQMRNTNTLTVIHNEFVYGGGWLGNRAAEFLIGWPNTFCCAAEPNYRTSRKNALAFFFQDDWKVTPRLSLNLGLRYEPQMWAYLKNDRGLIFIPGVQSTYANFPRGVVPVTDPASPGRSGRKNDINNFAPRLGVAYRLDDRGTMVVRGGWGLFYDSTDSNKDGVGFSAQFPFAHRYNATYNRGYPGPEGWLDIFKYTEVPVPDFSVPLDLSTAVFPVDTAPGVYFVDNKLGVVHQINLTFEHEFRPGWSYSLGYVGTQGRNLIGVGFWNLPVSRDASDSLNRENLASRRPFQDYRYVTKGTTPANATSSYHGGQSTLKARTKYFNLVSHYTYSASFADMDGIWGNGRLPSRPDWENWDWARTLSDRPHSLLVLPSWDLPFGRGRSDLLGKLFGGWTSTFIFQAASGAPVNIVAAQNNTFTCVDCVIRPNWNGQPKVLENWRKDPNLVYVNKAAFEQPADRTYGNLAKNAIRFPSTKNVDFNVTKSFGLYGENLRFDLKFDFFNLFNWVNWGGSPESINLGSSATNLTMQNRAGGPRNVQIGARIAF